MNNTLQTWAATWGVPAAAIADLAERLTVTVKHGSDTPEARVQEQVRLRAAELGMQLWRNNVGVAHDEHGVRRIRYGLANDSERVNRVCKSADLIGGIERRITQEMVGTTMFQFASVEAKPEGWRPTPSDKRYPAQLNWQLLILARGGYARIVTGADQL